MLKIITEVDIAKTKYTVKWSSFIFLVNKTTCNLKILQKYFLHILIQNSMPEHLFSVI